MKKQKSKVHYLFLIIMAIMALISGFNSVLADLDASNLTTYLSMDDSDVSGSLMTDIFGGADATIDGATSTTGIIGGNESRSFDGVNDQMTIPAGSYSTTQLSVCSWVNSQDTGTLRYIWDSGDNGEGTSFGIYKTATEDLKFTNHGPAAFDTGYNMVQGWQHICVTYDGSYVRVFVNGTETPTSNQSMIINIANSAFRLGRHTTQASSYWNGYIDEFAVFNISLSEIDVKNVSGTLGNGNVTCVGDPCKFAGGEVAGNPDETFDSLTFAVFDAYDHTEVNTFSVNVQNTTHNFNFTTNTGAFTKNLTNNTYAVKWYNISSNTYFNVTQTNFTVIGTLTQANITAYQSYIRINATDQITGAPINTFNVSAPLQFNQSNNGNSILLLKAGSYTLRGATQSHPNTTLTITTIALENTSHTLKFFENQFNISASDKTTGKQINTFSVRIEDTNSTFTKILNTKNGKIFINLSQGNFNFTINATNYANATTNQTSQAGNISLELIPTNSVWIRIYDEETQNLITNDNISLSFTSQENQLNLSTQNGTILAQNILPSTYTITLQSTSSERYNPRNYFITLKMGTALALDAYLLNTSTGATITFFVKDQADQLIEDATLTFQKQFNNSFKTIEQEKTDFAGSARATLKPTTTYTLIISHSTFLTRQVAVEPVTTSFTIYLSETPNIKFTKLFQLITYSYTPQSTTIPRNLTNFTLTTNSPTGNIQYFTIETYYNNTRNVDNITNSPSGGTALITLNLTNETLGTNFNTKYYIKVDGFNIFTLNKTYRLSTIITPGQTSLIHTITNTLNPELTPTTATILAVTTSAGAGIIMASIGGGAIGGIAAAATLMVTSMLGWVNMLLASVILLTTIVGLLVLNIGEGGR